MKAWFKAHKGQIILNLITILIIGSMLTIYGVKAASQRQASPGGFNPGVFSYQGYLSDKNGQPLTGEYPMVFRLYDQPTGGTVLWEEYREGPNQVPVIDGQVALLLGNLAPIPLEVWDHPQLYLEIVIANDSPLSPRVLLSAVPYAIHSNIADVSKALAPNAIQTDKIHPILLETFSTATTTNHTNNSIPTGEEINFACDSSCIVQIQHRGLVQYQHGKRVDVIVRVDGQLAMSEIVTPGPGNFGNVTGFAYMMLSPGNHTVKSLFADCPFDGENETTYYYGDTSGIFGRLSVLIWDSPAD